jgi:beta-lactamase superfamily II metal-dependent hydrolase
MKSKKRPNPRGRASAAKDYQDPQVKSKSRPSADALSTGQRGRIRIYRHGLGDCILVRLRRDNGSDYKILIDCGVAVATQNAPAKMTAVVEDVVKETGGTIDVLAVTHEHWDHVSGFMQAEDAFKKLKVGEVWVAWTEDLTDPLAQQLRKDHDRALAVLGASAARMALAGQTDRAAEILNIVGLSGAVGEKTRTAFEKAKAMGQQEPTLRYWQPDAAPHAPNQQIVPIHLGNPAVTIYALGPPHDAKLIRKTLQSKSDPETYELKLDGAGAFPATVASLLQGVATDPPFPPTVAIPIERAQGMQFFQDNYWANESAQWRRIDTDWLGAASDLALAMQSATNNTSLVLAFEFADGDVLLFAGDAQVGNWLSWQDRKWTIGGREVTGPDLLARTIFYKVGHHGSHNATLKTKGLEMMDRLKTAAIPVDQIVAKRMRWGAMPLVTLVEELNRKTNGRTFRTDLPPKNQFADVTVEDLYYEFEI